MIIEKVETGNFLTAGFVREKRLTTLRIMDEGQMVKFEQNGKGEVEKISLGVEYQNMQAGDPTTWTLNNKSRNTLIDIFGSDTSKWVGRIVEIKLEGTGEFEHLMVDTMRTK